MPDTIADMLNEQCGSCFIHSGHHIRISLDTWQAVRSAIDAADMVADTAGIEWSDDRLEYQVMQIDREAWDEFTAAMSTLRKTLET